MKIKTLILIFCFVFSSCKKEGPGLGVYDIDGAKTDIYCGTSNYIELKKEGVDNIVEFYSGSISSKSCRTLGNFKLDKNNDLTIFGLSNPNTYGAAEQFNGEYKWVKGTNQRYIFYNSCFYKKNSQIVLLNRQK